MISYGRAFWRSNGTWQKFNIFDVLVVLVCSFDLYLVPVLTEANSTELAQIRVFRLVRLSRVMRILRVSKTFSQLRVLIVTMISSIGSLFWSMVLLMILMYTFAVFLSQSLQYDLSELLASPGNEEMKLFLHNNYGTATKATWTMFEITFSGGWPTWVSPVVAEVSTAYTFIFALYVTVFVFAVTRIITALFLKDTLARAAEDTEMMLRETARK